MAAEPDSGEPVEVIAPLAAQPLDAQPVDAQPVTGYLFSRASESLAIGGTSAATGKLLFSSGGSVFEGRSALAPKTWNHVALVRDKRSVRMYLNGDPTPEISGELPNLPSGSAAIYAGGSADMVASFEGKLDEIAVYARPVPASEIAHRIHSVRDSDARER